MKSHVVKNEIFFISQILTSCSTSSVEDLTHFKYKHSFLYKPQKIKECTPPPLLVPDILKYYSYFTVGKNG